ncbi:hypothetical protein LTR37_008980 [Vermiconidia calcicola]|uniref:Uncharacterized protein n=1 Tax=Vermiconidia calcicola TaxID=1690605 RepID=A0ACC3N9B3_9PEZI|nr:hypothetical protein LTR37_008980 [Vermiconidia calcicola]
MQTVAHTQQLTIAEDKRRPIDGTVSSSNHLSPSQVDLARRDGGTLLVHTPQSVKTVLIIRAIDTLRREHVEEEWFRYLPSHAGHSPALDLSVKAIVAACAYNRGVPKLTSSDCHQALALAINALQANIKRSNGQPGDEILASTALLAPLEGIIKHHGIPTCLHVQGLAAILTARPVSYPVSQLAREILEWYACESAILACFNDIPSPFESVARAYFTNDRIGYRDSDRAQLKALSNEIFLRLPRLVKLVRSLRSQASPQTRLLLDAVRRKESLLGLQDSETEQRFLRTVEVRPSSIPDATLHPSKSLHFASAKDFEALVSYWHSRLSLFRLERRLHDLLMSSGVQTDSADEQGLSIQPVPGAREDEMSRIVKNIMMCSEYDRTLVLVKQHHLYAYALLTVWGVTLDLPEILSYDQDGRRKGALTDLLLRRMNSALAAEPALTVEDMNMAAEIFVGGQPKGTFAELYAL